MLRIRILPLPDGWVGLDSIVFTIVVLLRLLLLCLPVGILILCIDGPILVGLLLLLGRTGGLVNDVALICTVVLILGVGLATPGFSALWQLDALSSIRSC
mmetsp:Transcript_42674/g.113011  ORF Transcript_42674/g.113011 Transcript_42674/m.113011 type:complete len:100 (+) Transcript_42674:1592-1891(+)